MYAKFYSLTLDSSTSGLDLLFSMSGVVEWAEIHSDIAPDNGLPQGGVSGKPTGFDHRRLKNVGKFWAACDLTAVLGKLYKNVICFSATSSLGRIID